MRPDLRLAGFAVALWLAALACLYLPARHGLMLGGCALTAVVIPLLMARRDFRRLWRAVGGASAADIAARRVSPCGPGGRRHQRRGLPGDGLDVGAFRWVLAGVLLGAGCGAIATAARVSVREAGPLAALVAESATVTVELVVRDDPRALRGSPGLPPTYLLAVEITAVDPGDAPALRLSARGIVLGADPGWRSLLPGQRASATGRLLAPRGGDLSAAVLSSKDPPRLHGRSSWAQRAAGSLRAGLQRACAPLPDDVGGLLPGLVVGDTSRLDHALEEDFRATGMTHVRVSLRHERPHHDHIDPHHP